MGAQIDGWMDQPKIYRACPAGMAIVVQIIIMHTKNRSLTGGLAYMHACYRLQLDRSPNPRN